MKFLLFMAFATWASLVSANTAIETKVCTVFHDKKVTNCMTAEKKDYPSSILYGVSKLKKGQKPSVLLHRWNGKDTEITTAFEQNRILVSSFVIPANFNGEINFSVHSQEGDIINHHTYQITRGPMNFTAYEKGTVVDDAKPLTPPAVVAAVDAGVSPDVKYVPPEPKKVKMDMEAITVDSAPRHERQSPKSPEAVLAEPILKEIPHAKPVATSGNGQRPTPASEPLRNISDPPVQAPVTTHLGPKFLRAELHGSWVKQKNNLGDSNTAILYWAPEFLFSDAVSFGARLGGTQWKENNDKRFTAFESDAHVTLSLTSPQGKLSLQPLVGYHSWGKFGNFVGYGGNLIAQQQGSRFSFIGGAQAAKHKGVSYQFLNIGLGIEF